MVSIFPNPCLWRRSLRSNLGGIDLEKLYRATLNCCNSGRGKIKAEGVVGIARAFLGGGARSVIASLWVIDDETTLAFMRHFYGHLVAGQSASKSLDHAMKRMRESEKFNAVKYWAPFVLIGDDVTLNFGQ